MPSTPIRRPACSTRARSGASSSSMGLVLLMCVYTRCRLGSAAEPDQAAVGSGDRQMIHLTRRALADAQSDQLVVGPERPVEQYEVRAAQAGEQGVVQVAAAGDEGAGAAGMLVLHQEPHRVGRALLAGEPRRARGHREAGHPEPARRSVAIAEPERLVGHELGDGDLGERPGDGEQPRIVLDDPPDRVGGGHLQPPRLAQEHDTKRVVELGVGQDDALDRHMPGPAGAGVWRRPSCAWTSGEALRRNHRAPSPLTATDDWLRGIARRGSSRATRQDGHQQFHWGKPPPAAVPRRTMCMGNDGGGGGGKD